MPVLEVEVVGRAERAPSGLAQELAQVAAQVLGSPAGGCWVRLRFLDPQHYAENQIAPDSETPQPVFVRLLLRTWPDEDARAAVMRSLAQAIAACCKVPAQHVHVLLDPPGEGRIAFGGVL